MRTFGLWLSRLSLDQVGLILTFVGGLLMAVDIVGEQRTKKLETGVGGLKKTSDLTGFYLKHMTKHMASYSLALLSPYVFVPILFPPLLMFGIGTAVRHLGSHPLLAGALSLIWWAIAGAWLVVFGSVGGAVSVAAVVATCFWSILLLFWTAFSPLFGSYYLTRKLKLKGSIPVTGVLVMTTGFLLQLIAGFMKA